MIFLSDKFILYLLFRVSGRMFTSHKCSILVLLKSKGNGYASSSSSSKLSRTAWLWLLFSLYYELIYLTIDSVRIFDFFDDFYSYSNLSLLVLSLVLFISFYLYNLLSSFYLYNWLSSFYLYNRLSSFLIYFLGPINLLYNFIFNIYLYMTPILWNHFSIFIIKSCFLSKLSRFYTYVRLKFILKFNWLSTSSVLLFYLVRSYL